MCGSLPDLLSVALPCAVLHHVPWKLCFQEGVARTLTLRKTQLFRSVIASKQSNAKAQGQASMDTSGSCLTPSVPLGKAHSGAQGGRRKCSLLDLGPPRASGLIGPATGDKPAGWERQHTVLIPRPRGAPGNTSRTELSANW